MLFHHNCSFFRLAWAAFVTITITPGHIAPMFDGLFPEKHFRGKVCMLQDLQAGNEKEDGEIYKKDFFLRFCIVIQIFYAVKFYIQMTRYINGQCPGGKMSSIGKYRRNILGLQTTFWAGVSGSCFLLLQNLVRFVSVHYLSRWHAFYANFIMLDSLIFLFYVSIFCFVCLKDIPSVSDPPRRIVFYVSRPTVLEPRRPRNQVQDSEFRVAGQSTQNAKDKSAQIVTPEEFEEVSIMRKTVDPAFGARHQSFTIYRSPNSCGQKSNHQDGKLNVRIPKLTHVREYKGADRQKQKTSKQSLSRSVGGEIGKSQRRQHGSIEEEQDAEIYKVEPSTSYQPQCPTISSRATTSYTPSPKPLLPSSPFLKSNRPNLVSKSPYFPKHSFRPVLQVRPACSCTPEPLPKVVKRELKCGRKRRTTVYSAAGP